MALRSLNNFGDSPAIKRLLALNTSECLWIYVLKILSQKPTYAYALRNLVHKRFGFRPGMVSAYKVLYLLKQEGYVKSKKDGRITNYMITKSGIEILDTARKFYENQVDILKR
ncbi:MAG: PadR family transcriptional regulator [Candidatus Aenigmarchaeota archaeon]|nr:PadR family transcriptional regulator [Candidatus Aenigmarchaeota archaeon]